MRNMLNGIAHDDKIKSPRVLRTQVVDIFCNKPGICLAGM